MTAETIAKARNGRRCGAGYVINCVAEGHEDTRPSLSVRQAGDKILVNCFAGCTPEAVIAGLKHLGLWPEREQPVRTAAERAEWARQQRDIERVLPVARLWLRMAVNVVEDELSELKARLFDPLPLPEDLSEPTQLRGTGIYETEQLLARLRSLTSADLVAAYEQRRQTHPGATAALVEMARRLEAAERRAVMRFLRDLESAS